MSLIAVAKITGVFGLAGYVKIHLYAASPERLKKLDQLLAGRTETETELMTVADLIIRDRKILIKFESVNDRTAAEKMMGAYLFADEQKVGPPPKGSYFTHDIIGCEVWSDDGRKIGIVDEVHPFPAQDVWAVRTEKGKISLIPAIKEFIKEVNIKKRRVVVSLIEGLIEE